MSKGIYQRGKDKNTWTIVFNGPPKADGSRNQKTVTFKGPKPEAEKERRRLVREVDTGDYIEPTKLTVAQLFDQWMEVYAGEHHELKTYQTNLYFIRCHICHEEYGIGHVPLEKLRPLHLDKMYKAMLSRGRVDGSGGLSARTVRQAHDVVNAGLKWAKKKRLIHSNWAKDADPPKVRKKKVKPLDEAGTVRLLERAQGTRLYIPILLAVHTGMRQGEICALKWEDVDLDAGTITVCRSLQQVVKTVREMLPDVDGELRKKLSEVRGVTREKAPKNGETRVVPIPSSLVTELRRLKAEQAQRRLQSGDAYRNEGRVVAREDGSAVTPNSIATGFHQFTARLKAEGVPVEIRFHGLRHGFASHLAAAGVHPEVAKELLGHKTLDMTSHYTHAQDRQKAEAVNRLDAALRGMTGLTGTDGCPS